jgi:hypothetical protein
MDRVKRILLSLFVITLISNIPVVSAFLSVFLYSATGTTYYFITKDLHYFSSGTPEILNSREDYLEYKKKYPENDHTLYRCFDTRNWVYFFLWGEYLFAPLWQTPYLDLPNDIDLNKYTGHVLDNAPPYRWNATSEKWDRVNL